MSDLEYAILASLLIGFGIGALIGFAAGIARCRPDRPRYRRVGRPE